MDKIYPLEGDKKLSIKGDKSSFFNILFIF